MKGNLIDIQHQTDNLIRIGAITVVRSEVCRINTTNCAPTPQRRLGLTVSSTA
ncbi:TPA: hypothetical protein ACSP0D_001618 [Aeromonas veronii]